MNPFSTSAVTTAYPPPTTTAKGPLGLTKIVDKHPGLFFGVLIPSVFVILCTVGSLVILCRSDLADKRRVWCKRVVFTLLFIYACVSAVCNAYGALINERGVSEYMAIMDSINALATVVLTGYQMYGAIKASKEANGKRWTWLPSSVAFGLCFVILGVRIGIAASKDRKAHIYFTDLATLLTTLSGFFPVYVDLMAGTTTTNRRV